MNYLYFENKNYEDFAGGRVLYSKAGTPNYPVRLACEIFMRGFHILGAPDRKVTVYDPCCGGGYLLTVLGFLCGEHISGLYGSDIAKDSVDLAEKNLSLLTRNGLQKRKDQLKEMAALYEKPSHTQALKSLDRLDMLLEEEIPCGAFCADVLAPLVWQAPLADMVITDVPYGNLVSWSGSESLALDKMLEHLLVCLKDDGVVAISSDKSQKIANAYYRRVDRFLVGKRKIEILRKRS